MCQRGTNARRRSGYGERRLGRRSARCHGGSASPALIEKIRTAVTDGSGQYQIVNLPPGTYTITFSLTGFSTVRREGLDVRTNFTSNVDGEMRVGAVAGNDHGHRREPDRGHSVLGADADDDRPGVQGTAVGRIVDSDGGAVPAIRAGNTDVGGVLGDQTGAQV